jgi:hypothetical protein
LLKQDAGDAGNKKKKSGEERDNNILAACRWHGPALAQWCEMQASCNRAACEGWRRLSVVLLIAAKADVNREN